MAKYSNQYRLALLLLRRIEGNQLQNLQNPAARADISTRLFTSTFKLSSTTPSTQFPNIQPSAYPAINPSLRYHSSKGFPEIFFSSPALPNLESIPHINATQYDQGECSFGPFSIL